MDIGWIGIGNMGKPMAKNIQTYATKFTVNDLNQAVSKVLKSNQKTIFGII